MFVVFIKNPKKKHECEWTTECTTHGQGGTRLTIPQPHSHVQKAPLLVGESSAMWCDITCLWALATGANMLVALGWAQLLGIRWGHHWCFPPKAKALLPTTCGTQRHHRVGHGAHWPAVLLIVDVLWFIMKTLNLYRFLNSCPNQFFFANFLENVHIANGFICVECI